MRAQPLFNGMVKRYWLVILSEEVRSQARGLGTRGWRRETPASSPQSPVRLLFGNGLFGDLPMEGFLMAWTLARRSFLSLSALLGSGFELMIPPVGQAKELFTSRLGIITDELTEDFEKALDFISSQSLAYCEVRDLWQKNVVKLSQEELDRAKQLIERHRLKVSEIASPIFKYHLPGMPSPHPNLGDTFMAADLTDKDTENLLHRVFKLARFFGTSKVRVFSYWRVEEPEKAYPLRPRTPGQSSRACSSEQRSLCSLKMSTIATWGQGKSWAGCFGKSIRLTCAACGILATRSGWARFPIPMGITRSVDFSSICTSRM